ncbi:MAG: hypothetical protein IJY36_02345 [Coprobacter sp.]|nr:hypothetical protein [Coprobacter sp.]
MRIKIALTTTLLILALSIQSQTIDIDNGQWLNVGLERQITHPQPMTGLNLWPWKAKKLHSTYGQSIQLEFNYFLPNKIVKGCMEDGTIIYDWSYFDQALIDVAGRGHQLVARFRYEYPNSTDVDNIIGATAVPDYIKQLPDYQETYSESAGTYYADWSNKELQRFTLQFYTDFAQRYANDARLAFLEIGFGHWSEYHIFPTTVEYGKNFPSLEYQKEFLLHIEEVANGLPWLVSKNAANNSPIVGDKELMALCFGMFEDSFMGEYFLNDGYKNSWDNMGGKTRWQIGVIGGEIYPQESTSFLNPEGVYGKTLEEMILEYNITFMGCNNAPDSPYGTPERLKQVSMSMGYRFAVKECVTNGNKTLLLVCNEGIAPIYRDAYFSIGNVRSDISLKGLLPNEELWIEIDSKPRSDGKDINIVCDYILPQQEIEFEANIKSTINYDSLLCVTEALCIIDKLDDNTSTEMEFEIKGFITDIQEISIQNGNTTFVIAETGNSSEKLTIMSAKGLNGEPVTNENFIKIGNEVIVKGRLQKHNNQGDIIPSMTPGGCLISISNSTSGIFTPTHKSRHSNTIYNLSGRQQSQIQKGINIVDGHKVIILSR